MKHQYLPHKVKVTSHQTGEVLLESAYPLEPVARSSGQWLRQWAERTPGAVFLAERSGEGWREETYSSAFEQAKAIASSLLARGMDADTPILILSGNGIDHALLTLAAQYVGVPTVPVAEQYSLIEGAQPRLEHVIDLVRPAMVFAQDGQKFSTALGLDSLAGAETVVAGSASEGMTTLAELSKGDAAADLQAAHDKVGPQTIAKILMTSGSTSMPKGVITTQEMMCVNQTQIATSLPFLKDRPPRILDWLPWNHVFGGNHNFNMMLANGGSLYIDEGKPLKGLFDRSLENLSLIAGTLSFNVPVGFALLLEALKTDAGLRRNYFQDLDLIFYAGASLPQEIWKGLEALALEETGHMPLLTSSWGLTETSPGCTLQHQPPESSGVIGVPLPGVTAKLVNLGSGRHEIRVKGPNITPGYFRQPEQTKEAFDEEGYFITSDAVRFVDDNNPNAGLRFDGRITEDFKLMTGTRVQASALRLDLLSVLVPLCGDIVVTGQDREEIGLLMFPNREAIAAAGLDFSENGEILSGAELSREVARRVALHNENVTGSSKRIARVLVLAEPPSLADGEITAKGNLNFNQVLARRNALVERLYDDGDPATIKVEG